MGRLYISVSIEGASRVTDSYVLVKYPLGNIVKAPLIAIKKLYSPVSAINLAKEGNYNVFIFAKDSKGM